MAAEPAYPHPARAVAVAAALTVLATAAVLGVGVAASIGVSALVDEGMRSLGALVTGLLITGLLAMATLVGGAVVAMRRVRPPGDRAGPVVVLVCTLLLVLVLAWATTAWLLVLAAPAAVLAPALLVHLRVAR
jgi:hypothetical protein